MRTLLIAIALLLVLGLFAGCATTQKPEPVIEIRKVNVAVPVPCREPIPARPEFPTDALHGKPPLDDIVKAALAELDLLRPYADQLLTALTACTRPVAGRS